LKGEKVPPANDQFACGKMASPLLLNHVKEEAEEYRGSLATAGGP